MRFVAMLDQRQSEQKENKCQFSTTSLPSIVENRQEQIGP